jgi:hypothetical protein
MAIWGLLRRITTAAALVLADAPICRKYKVYAQDRLFAVQPQNRVFAMAAQSRTLYVQAQTRTFVMACRDQDRG